jgi:hypothetical protein
LLFFTCTAARLIRCSGRHEIVPLARKCTALL